MSRNPSGSIYYQRDNAGRTRVRISDDAHYRNGYRGFYDRMTRDIPFLVFPAHPQPAVRPPLPHGVVVRPATSDDFQCVVCNTNEHNIKFKPCNHTSTCSECYLQIDPGNTAPRCPMCRNPINSIETYIPPPSHLPLHVKTPCNPVPKDLWFDRVFRFHEMCAGSPPKSIVRRLLKLETVDLPDGVSRKYLLLDGTHHHTRFDAGIPLCLSLESLLSTTLLGIQNMSLD